MAGRNPNEAFQHHLVPLREALQCVTRERLILRERSRLTINKLYTVALGMVDPVPLQGVIPLRLAAGQIVRIVEAEPDDLRGPLAVQTVQYFYELSSPDGEEVLAFHWTPEAVGDNVVTFPHLHIGRAIVGNQRTIRPDDLHKAHIPTGCVPLEAVVRLAITEFGIRPLRSDWPEVLRRTEATVAT